MEATPEPKVDDTPAKERRATPAPMEPLVSVVVPCRNEVGFIGKCLDSILASEYPSEHLDVLVVDGMSDDGTREIVAGYASRFGRIKMLDNPTRTTPAALNIGIRAARGERIARMDAHATYPPEYLSRLIAWQDKTGADNVGGVLVTLPGGHSSIAHAIAIGLSHPFGVGNAHFRIGSRDPRWVDTVPFGCYRKDVFTRIGLFDEELVRNQDDEFNLRLIRRGGRILLVPEVVLFYYARASLARLWQTYYQYGYFKPLVALKVGGILTARQIVPAAFVSTLLIIGILAWWFSFMRWAWLGILAAYGVTVVAQAAWLGRASGVARTLALCVVFPMIHLSYGLGGLKGIVDWWLRPRGRRSGTKTVDLSR